MNNRVCDGRRVSPSPAATAESAWADESSTRDCKAKGGDFLTAIMRGLEQTEKRSLEILTYGCSAHFTSGVHPSLQAI